MKKIILFSLLFSLAMSSYAQFISIYPVSTLGTTLPTTFTCLVQYDANSIIVAGKANNTIVLMQISLAGVPMATRLLRALSTNGIVSGTPEVRDIILDSNGKLVLCGFYDPTSGSPGHDERAFVLRYDWVMGAVDFFRAIRDTTIRYYNMLEVGTTSTYLVCGEYDSGYFSGGTDHKGPREQDGIVDSVDNVGTITRIRRDSWTTGTTSDTHQAMTIYNNRMYLTGRFEHNGDDQMRPYLLRCNQFGLNATLEHFYITDISTSTTQHTGRLYSEDILGAHEGANIDRLYIPIIGDITNSDLNRDLIIEKTDLNGGSIWDWKYDINAMGDDGMFRQIALHSEAHQLLNDLVVLGTHYDGGSNFSDLQAKLFLIRITPSGSVVWGQTYDMELSHHLAPAANAMLIIDDFIYVVGTEHEDKNQNGILDGMVLCTPFSNGVISGAKEADCQDTLEVTQSDVGFDAAATLITPDWSFPQGGVTHAFPPVSVGSGSCIPNGAKYDSALNPLLGIFIYPNPVGTHAILRVDNENFLPAVAQVRDMTGKIILNLVISDIETSIPLDQLNNGYYYVTVINRRVEKSQLKLIVQ